MMTLNIGQQLKEIREAQGTTLEEIAQKTRIRLDYLKALEAGEDETLPSPVHIRGFLRLYASELGVKIADLEVKGYHLANEGQPPLQASSDGETIIEETGDTTQDLPSENQIVEVPENQEPLSSETPKITRTPPEPVVIPELSTSSQVFSAIGKLLMDRREMLSLSIKDIHELIFIPEKYLLAMESGQFDHLPSPVQARGMLQNYAEFLNLETDSLLLAYADSLQTRLKEKQLQTSSPPKKAAKELSATRLKLKSFFSLDLFVISALFLIFAGFVIWGVNRILSVDSPSAETTDLPEVSDILLATASPTPRQTTTGESGGEGTMQESTLEEEATPIFTPRPNTNPINLLIIPRQRVWVQVNSDSELVFEGRLIPGNVYDYSGKESIEVLTGNAGALQIYFNEEDSGALGVVGQVADLIFTQSGLVLPTPTNTPTITQTPQASPTPTITPTITPTPTLTPSRTLISP